MNFYRFWPTLMVLMLSAASIIAEDKNEKKAKPIEYQANLAKVPGADPKPTQTLTLVKELAGQHPRLLFTLKDIEMLQQQATKDALLAEAINDTIATAGQFPLGKGTPKFIKEDTPAIWLAGGTYTGLAYAYHLSKSATIREKIIAILTTMLHEPYWADAEELDSNMGAGNNMLMTGVLFDSVCNELDPEFRKQMAAKILVHIRRMWYLGHQQLVLNTAKYWQQDPQNNHRWHRNAGMAACLLAIADEPGLDTGYMLEKFKGEMDFITTWLPKDGDCHEGAGYQAFGFMYLALGTRMMDRVLGTTYQQSPGLRNAWAQQVYYWAPGRNGNMSFGDDTNGDGGGFDRNDAAFFVGPQLSHDPLAQAALIFRMQVMREKKKGELPWVMLPFYDSSLSGSDHLALPTQHLLVDLGAASMRDSWKPDAVALTFKCGPYGGYKLNEFAWHTGKQTYVNVAHDDPDANSFALAMAGDLIFHPGVYSMPKRTETISSILIDGKGQINEGSSYTQPVMDTDMRTLSYLTSWKNGESGRIIVEGEAGKAYKDQLKHFRRSVIWMPGDYILILDDIAALQKRAITWTGITEKGQLLDVATGTGTASGAGGKTVPFQIVADAPLQGEMKQLKLDARWGDRTMDQIRFTDLPPISRTHS